MDLFLSVVFFFYPDRSQQVLLILLWKHKPALLFIALLCGCCVSQALCRHCRAVQSSADIPWTWGPSVEQKRGTELNNKLFLRYLTTKMPSRGCFFGGCEKALGAFLSTLCYSPGSSREVFSLGPVWCEKHTLLSTFSLSRYLVGSQMSEQRQCRNYGCHIVIRPFSCRFLFKIVAGECKPSIACIWSPFCELYKCSCHACYTFINTGVMSLPWPRSNLVTNLCLPVVADLLQCGQAAAPCQAGLACTCVVQAGQHTQAAHPCLWEALVHLQLQDPHGKILSHWATLSFLKTLLGSPIGRAEL